MPFILEGLEADEPVMVAVIQERQTVLKEALGGQAEAVKFVDMGEIGRNPARIIPAWQRFVSVHAPERRPIRGIGEPIWAGRSQTEILECQLHEALLNVAVDPQIPFWLLCPYDTARLDASVIEEAHRSHPVIVDTETYHGSPRYGGRSHVDYMFGADLPEIPGDPRTIEFTPHNMHRIGGYVTLVAYTGGARADLAADLGVTAAELAAGSLSRGATSGSVRLWLQPDGLVCEVQDATLLDDPMAGRREPPARTSDSLWFANQLNDLVQLRSGPAGTTVRVHHRF